MGEPTPICARVFTGAAQTWRRDVRRRRRRPDPDVVAQVARQIAEVVRSGVQVAVVIGGGTSSGAPSRNNAGWSAPGLTTWACSAP